MIWTSKFKFSCRELLHRQFTSFAMIWSIYIYIYVIATDDGIVKRPGVDFTSISTCPEMYLVGKTTFSTIRIDLLSTCSEILKCLNFVTKLYLRQSSKWTFEFTGRNQILELIYTNVYTFVYLNKNWKIYWSAQSFLVCNQYRKNQTLCEFTPWFLVGFVLLDL